MSRDRLLGGADPVCYALESVAVLVHFLESGQPLCTAPHQLLGTRALNEVTCVECIERLDSMKKATQLRKAGVVVDTPTLSGSRRIA